MATVVVNHEECYIRHPLRWIFVVLACWGIAISYGFHVNLSIAIIGHKGIIDIPYPSPHVNSSDCAKEVDSDIDAENENSDSKFDPEDGKFDEDYLQGIMFSSYSWGFLIAQFPGATLSKKYSAKYVMLASVIVNIICSFSIPCLTQLRCGGVMALKFLQGIGSGITFPACHSMIGNWASRSERTTMLTLIYSGISIGNLAASNLSYSLTGKMHWLCIFCIYAALSVPWIILWIFYVKDSAEELCPDSQSHLSVHKRKKAIEWAWVEILNSLPFWASVVAHCCCVWGCYFYLKYLPVFMKHIFGYDLSANALRFTLPYIILIVCIPIIGIAFDYLIKANKLTVGWARKSANLMATIVPIGCCIGLCYVRCRPFLAITFMKIGSTFIGSAMFSGAITNIIDLGHNYCGVMMAMLNTAGTLTTLFIPIFVNGIIRTREIVEGWNIIFSTTACILGFGAIFFTLYAKGEEQPWNKPNIK